ncbi:MAG TPA: hypothetical protein VNO70_27760 [Blastocatellia bacterium]|nr:hypothetical protein [Blastocatellia bacterium]
MSVKAIKKMEGLPAGELRTADQLLIRTENSEYRFSVTDPTLRRGILAGGSLGDQRREAVLAGALAGDGCGFMGELFALKPQARAVFSVSMEGGVRHVVTSPIKEVMLLRGSAHQPHVV